MTRKGQAARRITDPPAAPLLIQDGVEVTDDAVWTWAQIPDGSTELMEDAELEAATWATAAAMHTLLPVDAEYHLKIMWARYSPEDYRDSWTALPGVRAPGADYYIELGAHRIARNSEVGHFRRRVVLLGVRWPTGETSSPWERHRRTVTAQLRSRAAVLRDARDRVEELEPAVRRWFGQMRDGPLRGVPAPAATIAWAYARELRRTADLSPVGEGELSGARLVSLMHGDVVPSPDGCYVTTRDAATGATRHVAVLVPAVNGFPADELEIPGGEWLALLTELTGVEASVRGVNHGRTGSLALLRTGRKWTRSQSLEAGEAGTAPPEEIDEAELALAERDREVRRRVDVLVTSHPRWVVHAETVEELTDRVEALRRRYTGIVALELAPHIQDLLWKELLPGDRVRVPEFGQVQPMRTLAGSWFHGGSTVGDADGPYIGGNLGATPGPVRLHLVSRTADDRRMPTTMSFTGRSGSGKSTAVMLTVLAALAEGAWCLLADPKGDLAGIVEVADRVLGVPVQVLDVTTPAAAGSMDPMRWAPTADEARALTFDALLGVLSGEDRRGNEAVLEAAIDRVLARPREMWSATAVIGELVATSGTAPAAQAARTLGETLSVRSRQSGVRAVLGTPADGAVPMLSGRGLVYLRLDGLGLPQPGSLPEQWTVPQRCAMTTFRASTAYALMQSRQVRELIKLVALTELHRITAYPEGRSLVQWLARTGRALKTYLLLDSQSAVDMAAIEGLVEQLVMSAAFEALGREEQQAQAVLLHRPDAGPRLRQAQGMVGPGECVMRDRHNRLGLVVFDRLTEWIADTLSTDAAEDSADLYAYDIEPADIEPPDIGLRDDRGDDHGNETPVDGTAPDEAVAQHRVEDRRADERERTR
ncbi:ATP-binding protein [Saccharothrix longispora]|uniref:ATP-binding protein n=1 Tax=Saccharothrix longispora TaxID=33920 RepID=UPI0028FD6078|nr:ATP-binding protein [Saccharothrix longispora]MDU0293319.1 ATP-binding protein [Saccharothrix longispora]